MLVSDRIVHNDTTSRVTKRRSNPVDRRWAAACCAGEKLDRSVGQVAVTLQHQPGQRAHAPSPVTGMRFSNHLTRLTQQISG